MRKKKDDRYIVETKPNSKEITNIIDTKSPTMSMLSRLKIGLSRNWLIVIPKPIEICATVDSEIVLPRPSFRP